jgi:hypothetical protein
MWPHDGIDRAVLFMTLVLMACSLYADISDCQAVFDTLLSHALCMCRSQDELKSIGKAVMQGIGALEGMLQDQAARVDGVVRYCQALQQGQEVLLQGNNLLIAGQRVMLKEVVNLHRSVLVGSDTLSQVRSIRGAHRDSKHHAHTCSAVFTVQTKCLSA